MNLKVLELMVWLHWLVSCGASKNVPLESVRFQPGDTILTPFFFMTNRCLPIYHAFFALTDEIAMHFGKQLTDKKKVAFELADMRDLPLYWELKKGRAVAPRRLTISVPSEQPRSKLGLRPRSRKLDVHPLGKRGITLAWRVVGLTNLPYDLQRCNCRHYSDYFTYGRTFGSWVSLGYQPVNDECPVHNIITPKIDTGSNRFVLRDNLGNEYTLNPDQRQTLINQVKGIWERTESPTRGNRLKATTSSTDSFKSRNSLQHSSG